MKKRVFNGFFKRLFLTFILTCGFLYSCRNYEKITPIDATISIEEAQQWIKANELNSASARQKKITRNVIWKNVKYRDNRIIALVQYEPKFGLADYGWRTAVFGKNKEGKINATVLELIADSTYLKKNNGRIDKNTFTGVIVEHDWSGEFIGGSRWENGKAAGQVIEFASSLDSLSIPKTSGRTNSCGYQYGFGRKVNGVYEYTVVWVSQPCWNIQSPWGGTDWAAIIDYQYISAYEAQLESQRQYECYQKFGMSCEQVDEMGARLDVINQLTTPCFSNTVKTIVDDISSRIGMVRQFDRAYGANDNSRNIIFREDATAFKDNPNGVAKFVNGLYTASKKDEIVLNPAFAPNGIINPSREFIAAVVLHEMVHGIISEYQFEQLKPDVEHAQMLQDWVEPIAQALQNIFYVPENEAIALSLSTLSEYYRQKDKNGNYLSTFKPAINKLAVEKYKTSLSDAEKVQANYSTGSKGYPCK